MSSEETLPAERSEPPEGGPGPEAREPIASGARVDRYTLLQRIGAGATGVVFTAYDPRLDRKVALKVLHGSGTAALSEARALAKLSHGNVVAVHDVGTAAGHDYVAMAFVQGPTLGAWMRDDTATATGVQPLLGVLLGAGRGLAAAHAVGLVHRDFKPANVLVKDGRIAKVVDFGLAAAAVVAPDDTTQRRGPAGTPAYMAPEVFEGRDPDARSDQFSFCVSAYEALYGHRPFAGDTPFSIMEAVLEHRLVSETNRRRVPSELRAAVVRGLATDPTDRWPTMEALLDAMARAAGGGGQRTVAWAVGIGASVLALAVVGGTRSDPRRACEAAGDAIAEGWNPARRQAVREAFVAVDAPYAETTLQTVSTELDAYAQRWRDVHVAACRERSRGVASEVLFDRRLACLSRGRVALTTLVELMAAADRQVVLRSVAAARGLPDVDACRHVESLLARQAPPDDPETAREVERIRAELARAETERAAGRRSEADARIADALQAARATGYPPVLIDALLTAARNTVRTDREALDAALGEAWTLALATDDDVAAADVAVLRVQGYAVPPAAGARADDAVATATGLVERLAARNDETAPQRRQWVDNGRGFIALRRGQTDQAIAIFRRLADDASQRWGADDRRARMHAHALAMAVQANGDFAEAAEIFEAEVGAAAAELGDSHPQVALIRTNLGLMLKHLGRFEAATAALRTALLALDGVPGYERDAARAHDNLAEALFAAGEREAAIEHYARGATVRQPSDPPPVGAVPRLLHYARALVGTPAVDDDAQRRRRARDVLQRALSGAEAAGHAAYQADALSQLSRLSIDADDYDLGVAQAKDAWDVHPGEVGSPARVALALAHADAQWLRNDAGDRRAAKERVAQLQASLAQHGDAAEPSLATLTQWLDRPDRSTSP